MSRVFAYCRVSTVDQNTQNQIIEIKTAGFAIETHRLIEENISGSVAAKQRPGFNKLIDRMEQGDVLVVTKLDRLGRNAMDVRATVEQLASSGVRVHCLALGGVDLTSPAGKMTMQVIAAVAEFERDLLIERTQSGILRAKAAGKRFGRRPSLNTEEQTTVLKRLNAGDSVAQSCTRVQDDQTNYHAGTGSSSKTIGNKTGKVLPGDRGYCPKSYATLVSFV